MGSANFPSHIGCDKPGVIWLEIIDKYESWLSIPDGQDVPLTVYLPLPPLLAGGQLPGEAVDGLPATQAFG